MVPHPQIDHPHNIEAFLRERPGSGISTGGLLSRIQHLVEYFGLQELTAPEVAEFARRGGSPPSDPEELSAQEISFFLWWAAEAPEEGSP